MFLRGFPFQLVFKRLSRFMIYTEDKPDISDCQSPVAHKLTFQARLHVENH